MASPGDDAAFVDFQVSVDGTKDSWVPVSSAVQSVDVEDNDRLTDQAVIVLDDSTGMLAHASFEGLLTRVTVGWQAEHATVFEGVIRSSRMLALPGGQGCELTAFDFSYFMSGRALAPDEWKPGERLSTVIDRLVTRTGNRIRTAEILPVQDRVMDAHRPVGQVGGTEWQFILGQAELQGCLAFVEFVSKDDVSKFYFLPIKSVAESKPVGTLTYCQGTGSLLEFSFERVSSGALALREAGAMDPATGQVVEQKAPAEPPKDPVPPPATVRNREATVAQKRAIEALTELGAKAAATLVRPVEHLAGEAAVAATAVQVEPDPTRRLGLNGRGVAIGNVQLRAKSMVTIKGVASWAEGDWYLTKVNHVYSRVREKDRVRSSYHTKFTATR
ncbi:hypothetical protein PV396_11035 [Streptomyces sp. ME02-8801-2C]|uniref:hypothetical protein n=1 Tax=Streptomyces sp. ME02-8801-2C TaxID=3028680 RepID=UPI0029A22185|nr:hypothetical protein [Streptomyces sp. ME02-8801-2C]MDX3452473.1 hypothetical protein [Streptomyces sp. ME02-8801-2C]